MSKREALMVLLDMTEEDFKRIARLKKATTPMSIDQEIELLETIRKERNVPQTQTNGGCPNGQHCQRILSEAELEAALSEGWRVAAVLPSGKIVVANE